MSWMFLFLIRDVFSEESCLLYTSDDQCHAAENANFQMHEDVNVTSSFKKAYFLVAHWYSLSAADLYGGNTSQNKKRNHT